MNAGWVAISVRAQAMTRRRLGRSDVAVLAASTSLDEGLSILEHTAYGRQVRLGQDLAEAQRGVTAAWLWNVRVLAGWGPRGVVTVLRPLVASLEVANTLDHLQRLQGRAAPPPYRLGGLATAWNRLALTTSADELRSVLAASAWGDPGDTTPRAVGLGMRAVLAERVVTQVPSAASWAAGGLALALGGLLVENVAPPPAFRTSAARVLGRAPLHASTLHALGETLPAGAAWALADIDTSADLWRAEARWWGRVEQGARVLTHHRGPGAERVVGAVALMAVDAWRVRAALEAAASSGSTVEGFDEVA